MKPEEVLHNWHLPNINSIDQLNINKAPSGLLNKTFLITSNSFENQELFVLQLVHPAVSMDGSINNYFHVTQFLSEQGFVVQELLPTTNEKLWIEDENSWRWRLLKGVNGNVFDNIEDLTMVEEAGKLLGSIDAKLPKYPRPLEQGRRSFYYTDQIEKLVEYKQQFLDSSDEQIREAWILLHEQLPKLLLPTNLPTSITHGDPKVSNFVFSEQGKAICMIDFDTLQNHSPLFDIADAIRSWCGGDEADPNNSFNKDVYQSFMAGYLNTSKGLLSKREQSLIPQVCQLVMLGLASRFLIDYIDDFYFGWDETKYNSRKDHNKARTLGQISLYQSYIKSI